MLRKTPLSLPLLKIVLMSLFIWSDGDGLFIPYSYPCRLLCPGLPGHLTSLELHSTLKYLKKEIYLRQPDRKVPEIDGIWNLLRFPICSSLKLIKHSLLAGGNHFLSLGSWQLKTFQFILGNNVLCSYYFGPILRIRRLILSPNHHTALYICRCRCRMYPGVGGGVVSVCFPACHSNLAHKQLKCFHLAAANNAA